MKKQFFFVLTFLVSLTLSAEVIENYSFFLKDSYLSTLIPAFARVQERNPRYFSLKIIKSRDDVPVFGKRNELVYSFLHHSGQNKPLVVVIPGLGSLPTSSLMRAVAENLWRQGNHVLVISSPFSWNFALCASHFGLPGHLPNDLIDIKRVIDEGINHLSSQVHVRFTEVNLIGFSLGAFYAAWLSQHDFQTEKTFNKTVLINPPIKMEHSLKLIDQYFEFSLLLQQREPNYQDRVMGNLLSEGEKLLGEVYNEKYYQIVGEMLLNQKLRSTDYKWLIGNIFRENLAKLVNVSQAIENRGVLQTPLVKKNVALRTQEAFKVSFWEYYNEILISKVTEMFNISKEASLKIQNFDLPNLKSFFSSHKNIFIMHNEDDFLLTNEDLLFLQETFNDRAFIFPYGGHLGNFYHQDNLKILKKILSF